MISLQSGFEHDTLAVRASGVIAAEDFSTVLVPELERRLKDHASVRMWYEIAPECSGMQLSSLWHDILLGVFHHGDFQRVAIITDEHAFCRFGRLIAMVLPCPVRVFSSHEEVKAREWFNAKH